MAKNRILVIDDELDLLGLVKARLEMAGYEVLTAIDGEEGLAKARASAPDLIILDIMLPKMDGFEVCEALKIDEKYKHIPIIILTVKFQPVDIRFAKALGADAYITQPFEAKELLDKIKELIKK